MSSPTDVNGDSARHEHCSDEHIQSSKDEQLDPLKRFFPRVEIALESLGFIPKTVVPVVAGSLSLQNRLYFIAAVTFLGVDKKGSSLLLSRLVKRHYKRKKRLGLLEKIRESYRQMVPFFYALLNFTDRKNLSGPEARETPKLDTDALPDAESLFNTALVSVLFTKWFADLTISIVRSPAAQHHSINNGLSRANAKYFGRMEAVFRTTRKG